MAKDKDDTTWYKRAKTEDDAHGVYIGEEIDPESNTQWFLLHGGDQWRNPWTY